MPGPSSPSRNFTLLTTAAIVTGLGNQGALIASAFAVLDSGGSAGDVGLVSAARTLALVVFLLVGGALADRIPRHRVMVGANLLNLASQGTFAALVLLGRPEVWQMALLAAAGGTGNAFFNPANEAMVMSTAAAEGAGRRFALYRFAVNGATVAGAAVGGALVAAVGPGWVLAVDSAGFAATALLRSFLDLEHLPERARARSMLADLRAGWREFTSRSWLWAIVAQCSVINAIEVATIAVYGPLIARDSLGGAGAWGIASAASGVGTVAGALVMTRWQPHRLLLSGTAGLALCALPSVGLAVPLPVVWLTLLMFLAGASGELFGVAWMTALHQEVPEEMWSRVSSYDWLGSMGFVPVGTALAGPAASAFGRSGALWGGAGLIVLLTVAVLFVPGVRGITRRPPGSAPAAFAAGHPPVGASPDAEGPLGRTG